MKLSGSSQLTNSAERAGRKTPTAAAITTAPSTALIQRRGTRLSTLASLRPAAVQLEGAGTERGGGAQRIGAGAAFAGAQTERVNERVEGVGVAAAGGI